MLLAHKAYSWGLPHFTPFISIYPATAVHDFVYYSLLCHLCQLPIDALKVLRHNLKPAVLNPLTVAAFLQ